MDFTTLFSFGILGIYYVILALVALRAYRSVIKRKRVRNCVKLILLLCLLVYFGLSVGLLPGSQRYQLWEYTRKVTGKGLFQPIYDYDSQRSFTGDGFSILVFNLSERHASYFSTPPKSFYRDYPKKPLFSRGHWDQMNWRTGKPRVDEQRVIHFALQFSNIPSVELYLKQIRISLAKPTTHYAYLYYKATGTVSDIDFFVIDPIDKRLYVINCQT